METNTPPRFLTTAGASVPADFIGRERELSEIRERLVAGRQTLALVNAEGGMGKTTLAAAYWNRFQEEYQHLAWLYCEQGIVYAMTTHLPGPLELIETMNRFAGDPAAQARQITARLANLPKPCLLVLDNANEPEHIRGFETFCTGLGWHVLITSRCANVLSDTRCEYPIASLPPREARQLFKGNYDENTDAFEALLGRFLQAVGYNTLCIEVFSKTLHAGKGWGLDFAALLQKLEQNGLRLGAESFQIRTLYTHSIQSEAATGDQIVAALYDANKLPAEAQDLLARFCLLPAENHRPELLITLLAPDDWAGLKRGLDTLVQHGWISIRDGAYRSSPVVQKIILDKYRERLWELGEAMVQRLNAMFENEGYHTKNIATAGPYADLVFDLVDNLGVWNNEVAQVFSRLWVYYTATGNLTKAMETGEKMLFFSEKNEDKPNVAIAFSRLGSTHTALGNLPQALTFFEQYNLLKKELHEAFPQNVSFKNNLAISYSKLGETHTALGNLPQALTFFEQYNQLEKELHEAFPQNVSIKNGLAISYSKLGSTHTALGNLPQALTFFEKFAELMKELYEAFPLNVSFKNNLAISYSKLGETQTALGNLPQALTFFEKDIELSKELHEAFPLNVDFKNGLAVSYSKLGETHTVLGNLPQALTFFEDETCLFEELHEAFPQNVDFKNGLAISYEKLGSTHTALGNLQQALTFFEDETRLFEELHEAFPQNVSFKNGLAISCSKLGSTHTALGNLPKALTFFEKCTELMKALHEAFPQNVDFKNGLAVSFSQLGQFYRDYQNDPAKAKTYFQQCFRLFKELSEAHPEYVEFRNNYEWAKTALEG
jgi:tetratricopeptide (TPR) repeat protein